jgi:hypothetical protein
MIMDQKGFISKVDTALAKLVWGCIENDSAATAIISSQEQISFSSPKTANTRANKKLSIFLYNITEETAPKNMPPPKDGSRKLASRLPFALHYLVTPFTGNEKDDHVLLEKIIQMFLDKPLISVADAKNTNELTVKIDSLSLDELSRLWTALDAPLRLSVSLTVSVSNPFHNPQTQMTEVVAAPQTLALETSQIIQLYHAVLKTFTEQSTAWRSRNMVLRQWVLQDFQKNSGMNVEEMQNMLNSLGDKLEHRESSAQFIKPLNQLAGYYQHQLDELKGLHKISHKQTENLETITMWIKDVRALVEEIAR